MSSIHTNIKAIINKVLSEDREPLKDILDHENTEDVVHATHLTMDGGEKGGPEAENLVMPVDHAAASGTESNSGVEVIQHPVVGSAKPVNNVVSYEERGLKLGEAGLRKSIRNILIKVL